MKSSGSIHELKITLRHVRPPVWRRLRVRGDVTLHEFHGILQSVMGWMDSHLHQFVAKGKCYGRVDPEFPEGEDERKKRLGEILRKPGDSLVYEYDFGDGWEHLVVLEQILEEEPAGKYPYVVTGRRACPPEDCGGPGGYGHLLQALARPRHPEHAEVEEWIGGSFDPGAFDAAEINRGFHGGWSPPASPGGARGGKSARTGQMTLKLETPRRRG